ncbi:hypothetical protein [Aquimarina sp. 2201CG5-10]|uniref:hypothetical protein n=1 Tax=Aquimarina callyspongiae TaxID=3098150 RepID=UPI002AB58910|nr:hypothetical protein [Aquimarina sp. 2201CG5-10]MDY8136773.1 hypothetical protein [Aquimarina sp. 2201CG5-10]
MKRLNNLIRSIMVMGITMILVTSCTPGGQDNAEIERYKKQIKELKQQVAELQEQIGSTDRPKRIISSAEAQIIFQEYNKRSDMIKEYIQTDAVGNRFDPTRSLYYPIDELRNYMAYIHKISKEADVKPTGYRFYFAAYPEEYERELYAKRQTMFIAPTIEKKDASGKTKQVAYLFDKNKKVLYLDDIIQEPLEGKKPNVQKGSLFSFLSNLQEGEISTVANELAGSPPMGN